MGDGWGFIRLIKMFDEGILKKVMPFSQENAEKGFLMAVFK